MKLSMPPMQKPTTPIDVAGRRIVAGEEVDGAAHVATGPIGRHRLHQLAGLVHLGVLGELAVIEVGASATNPSAASRSAISLMPESSPHHSCTTITPGPEPPSGSGQVPGRAGAVARKVDDLSCEISHVSNGRRWSRMCHTLAP